MQPHETGELAVARGVEALKHFVQVEAVPLQNVRHFADNHGVGQRVVKLSNTHTAREAGPGEQDATDLDGNASAWLGRLRRLPPPEHLRLPGAVGGVVGLHLLNHRCYRAVGEDDAVKVGQRDDAAAGAVVGREQRHQLRRRQRDPKPRQPVQHPAKR
jgi:hypothetical protein